MLFSGRENYQTVHMSKRTLALIVILTVITGALLVLALSSQKQQKAPSPIVNNNTPTPIESPATAMLSLSQNTTMSTSASKALNLDVDGGGSKVTGVQVEISYDPKVLTNVSITPGSYIENPVVLFNSVDKKNGRISYAVGITPTGNPVTGTGTAAIIKYSVLPGVTINTTTLHFLSKTIVAAEGVNGSILKSASDMTISLK